MGDTTRAEAARVASGVGWALSARWRGGHSLGGQAAGVVVVCAMLLVMSLLACSGSQNAISQDAQKGPPASAPTAARRDTKAPASQATSAPPSGQATLGFGYKVAWLAVQSPEPDAVAAALGLSLGPRVAWAEGVYAAHGEEVFVSDPVAGWVFVLSARWMDDIDADTLPRIASAVAAASSTGGRAAFFASHRVVELAGWILAEGGVVSRAYFFVGESGEFLCNMGPPSEWEKAAGIQVPPPDPPGVFAARDWDPDGAEPPDEEDVVSVASKFSIDPTSFGERQPAAGGWLARSFVTLGQSPPPAPSDR